jgi:hypothetical protein
MHPLRSENPLGVGSSRCSACIWEYDVYHVSTARAHHDVEQHCRWLLPQHGNPAREGFDLLWRSGSTD